MVKILKTDIINNLRNDDITYCMIAVTLLGLSTGTAFPIISLSLAGMSWLISGRIAKIRSVCEQSWFYPVILFFILPWMGLLFSKDPSLGTDYALKTKYLLIIFITAGLILNQRRIQILVVFFVTGLLSGVFLSCLQLLGLMEQIQEGFWGWGTVHTLLSSYIVIGILITSFYFSRVKGVYKKIGILFVIVCLIFHLGILRGRGGYVVFLCVTPLIAQNMTVKLQFFKKLIVWLALIVFLLSFPMVRSRIIWTINAVKVEYNSTVNGEQLTGKFVPRAFIYVSAYKVFKTSPIFGVGTGSLGYLTKKDGEMIEHPHNNLLYMGVSFGIIGFFSCLWLFWTMFRISWQSRGDPLGYFIASICIVLFISGFFDTQILNTGTLILLSLGYGLLNHLPR